MCSSTALRVAPIRPASLGSRAIGGSADRVFVFVPVPVPVPPTMVPIADNIFKLDGDHYRAHFVGHLEQRNFGRVTFKRVAGAARRCRIQTYIEGERDAIAELFELDLDARAVRMRNSLGAVLTTSGLLTIRCVHDPSGGFGSATDRVDGEIVDVIDTEPYRAFGFQLRSDANLPVRQRGLGLLRG